ncbi:MAG: O-antigen ligase family protein [Acidobacteria bacterium]|nr:O-antigen ligase family protein [Acidobacteriota bacterium]
MDAENHILSPPQALPFLRSGSLVRLFDRLVLGGLFFTLAVLPLQAFSGPFAMGMCALLLFLCGCQTIVRKKVIVAWTMVHSVLLAFLGVALLQLLPLPFHFQPVNLGLSFNDLPVTLDHWSRFTLDPSTTASAAAVLASIIGFFFIASHIIDAESKLRAVVDGVIIIGFAISFLGLLDMFSPPGAPLLKGGGNPLGLYYYSLHRLIGFPEMVFALPVALMLSGAVRRTYWPWYSFAAITIGLSGALSESTGAILVLTVELMCVVVFIVKRRAERRAAPDAKLIRIWTVIGVLIIAGTIAAGVAWLSTRSIPRMVTTDIESNLGDVRGASAGSATAEHHGRVEIMKATLRMLIDHPLLGVGLGVHPILYTFYDPSPGLKIVNAAHNDYLQLLAETGLVGGGLLALFLLGLYRLMQSALRSSAALHWSIALGAGSGVFGMLVHSLIDFHLQSPGTAMLFMVLIAVLVAVARLDGT